MTGDQDELPEHQTPVNGVHPDNVYLHRQKESAPSLVAQHHPHGVSPPSPVHPHSAQGRERTYGNDNSSVNRQSRSQSARPDPIPGKSAVLYWKHHKTSFLIL